MLGYEGNTLTNFKAKQQKNKNKELKFLKDKNYFYYTFWYPFYLKRIQKRSDHFDVIKLFDLNELNPVRMYGLGDAIRAYFKFQPFLKTKVPTKVFSTHYSNLMIYYAYNAGFNRSTNNGLEFINIDEYNVIMIDIRYSKPRIFCIEEHKCVATLTSGIIMKLLDIKEKSLKKSSRVLNVMIKTSLKKIQERSIKKKHMVFIKGVKQHTHTILDVIKNNVLETNLIVFFNPSIRKNKIRFKKIKSIKRNLLKKFLRSENSRL